MRGAAVLAPCDLRLARTALRLLGGSLGQILDADCELQLLADKAKARRLVDDQTSVTLVGPSGKHGVERRADRFCSGAYFTARRVVHLPIGDHRNPGEALARHIRHRAIECGEQSRAVATGPGLRLSGSDDAQVEVALARKPVLQRHQRRLGGLLAIANALAR